MRITPDMVKDLDTYLPQIVMVYLVDGYGENGMYYTFDGREVGGNVVKWDYSGVSDSYDGGEYVLKLTFGDGNTLNYHIEIPITVIPQALSAINGFAYSNDEDNVIVGNSLTYEAGETPTLPDRVYAEFGTLGSKLYEIRWKEDTFTSNYAGATYYVDAFIGNSEIGYHLYENIPIVFKSKLITKYNFDLNDGRTYSFVFDPYVINDGDNKPESMSLYSYPRYANLHFENDVDEQGRDVYVTVPVEWNFDNVVNTYEGSSDSFAYFRYGDEKIGYQIVKVNVKIQERIFTSSMLDMTAMNLVTEVDPLYLNSKGEVKVTGFRGKQSFEDYDPTDVKNYPTSVKVTYGTGKNDFIIFSGDDVKWSLGNIEVKYDSGTQYAVLRLGNEAGGYQTINIPITIRDRRVSAIDLSAIRSKYEFDPYEENASDSKWYPEKTGAVVVFASQAAEEYPISWDLSNLDQSYKGGTYTVYARVGTDKVGYQLVPFTVVVKEKIIQNLQIESFVFDPYDTSINPMDLNDQVDENGNVIVASPYPKSATAVFKDDSTHPFSNLVWDITSLNKIWNYKGGETTITVKFGNAYGGYQVYEVPVKVECREIQSVEMTEIVFDPYGGVDPRLESSYEDQVNVTFSNGEKGVISVIWDIGKVISGYKGWNSTSLENALYQEFPVSIRAGNSVCGYQTFDGIRVRILNREIEDTSMSTQYLDVYSDNDLASSVSVTFKDGTTRTMNVSWINLNFRTDINDPTFPNWDEANHIDEQEAAGFTADARIGDAIGGYQIITVPVRVYKRVATALYIDNVKWSNDKENIADALTIDYDNHYFVFDPYDGKMEMPSTVQLFFNDGTDTYMKAVWDISHIELPLAGEVYGGSNRNAKKGAILRLGNARTGYIEIEFMVVVLNRVLDTVTDERGNKVPAIYDVQDGKKGSLITTIINDPYLSSGFPNTVYLEFAKMSGIKTLTQSEDTLKVIGKWNIEYTRDQYGNKVPIRASFVLGSERSEYRTYTFEVTTVFRSLSVPESKVVDINPYQISLPSVLTVNVGSAMRYDPDTGSYEPMADSVVTPLQMTFRADWSKATIDYSYTGGLQENVVVYVGNTTCGYQESRIKVNVLDKTVQSISTEEFEIDPYDYGTLPATTNVTFEDKTSGELKLYANISNAIKDPENPNSAFYQGGKYTVKAFLGDRTGGYQPVTITLNVKDRTITALYIGGQDVMNNGLHIATYGGENGITADLDTVVIARFADGTERELKALWNSVSIDYDYHGGKYASAALLVGNSDGGYQRVIFDIFVEKAVAQSATVQEGFAYNTLLGEAGLPETVVVTFTESSYVRTLVLPVAAWGKDPEIDRENGTYTITAKIGNKRSGYQEITVSMPLADIELLSVTAPVYTINGYDEIKTDKEGRLLNAQGDPFVVIGEVGEGRFAELYVKLLEPEKIKYTYLGASFVTPIEVGNEQTGYMSVTTDETPILLDVLVKAQIIRALYPVGESKDIVEYYHLASEQDPYNMPAIGKTVSVLMADDSIVTLPVVGVYYTPEGGSRSKYVSYKGYKDESGKNKDVLMEIEVGDSVHGIQTYERIIHVAEKKLKSIAELSDMIVDPFLYTLPNTVTVTFTDDTVVTLPVFYEVNGRPFNTYDLKYSGGNYAVKAKVGGDQGGKQDFYFTLTVKQMLVKGLNKDELITIDQLESTLDLPTSLQLLMMNGEVATASVENGLLDNGEWRVVFKDGAFTLQAENGKTGSWDFSGVSLDHNGGSYYAVFNYGNERAGYQRIKIPVAVNTKLIDYDRLQYVKTRTASTVSLAPFMGEITAAVGEYFELPRDLWITFTDGTGMQVSVTWDAGNADITKVGVYEVSTKVLDQPIKVIITITEDRQVHGDDVVDLYVLARGGNYTLPETITQTIYVKTASGGYYPASGVAPTMQIDWKTTYSSAVEDSYELIGYVSNGTFTWEKRAELYFHSTYITYVKTILPSGEKLGTKEGETYAKVKVGTLLSAADLPKVRVAVYDGEAEVMKDTAVNWTIEYALDANGNKVTSVANLTANDLTTLDTTKTGYVYVLKGTLINRKGEQVKYKGGDILFSIEIDEDVDLATMYTVSAESNVFRYGEATEVVFDYLDPNVKKQEIVYYKGEIEVGSVTYDPATGLMTSPKYHPTDAGEYRVKVTLAGYEKTLTVTLDVPYVILQKDIGEEIVVIRLKHRFEHGSTFAVSYGSPYGVPLTATYAAVDPLTYEVLEEQAGLLENGLPCAIGTYKVVISVNSVNYTGETVVYMEVVRSIEVSFHGEDSLEIEHVGEGMYLKEEHVAVKAGMAFDCWCSDEERTKEYDLSRPITGDQEGKLNLYARFKELS